MQREREGTVPIRKADQHVVPPRPDVNRVRRQRPVPRRTGRDRDLFVGLFEELLLLAKARYSLHRRPNPRIGAVGAEDPVRAATRYRITAQALESSLRKLEIHLQTLLFEMDSDPRLRQSQIEENVVELIARDRVDGLAAIAIGLVLDRTVQRMNVAPIAGHRDLAHPVARANPVQCSKAPFAEGEIDRTARRSPSPPWVRLAVVKMDFVPFARKIRGDQGTNETRTNDTDSFHAASPPKTTRDRTPDKAGLLLSAGKGRKG